MINDIVIILIWEKEINNNYCAKLCACVRYRCDPEIFQYNSVDQRDDSYPFIQQCHELNNNPNYDYKTMQKLNKIARSNPTQFPVEHFIYQDI